MGKRSEYYKLKLNRVHRDYPSVWKLKWLKVIIITIFTWYEHITTQNAKSMTIYRSNFVSNLTNHIVHILKISKIRNDSLIITSVRQTEGKFGFLSRGTSDVLSPIITRNWVKNYFFLKLTSLGMGWTKVFKMALKIISHRFRVIKVWGMTILGA